jgi:hypothetical protein
MDRWDTPHARGRDAAGTIKPLMQEERRGKPISWARRPSRNLNDKEGADGSSEGFCFLLSGRFCCRP